MKNILIFIVYWNDRKVSIAGNLHTARLARIDCTGTFKILIQITFFLQAISAKAVPAAGIYP